MPGSQSLFSHNNTITSQISSQNSHFSPKNSNAENLDPINPNQDIYNFTSELVNLRKEKSSLYSSYKLLENDASQLKNAFTKNLALLKTRDEHIKNLQSQYYTLQNKNESIEKNSKLQESQLIDRADKIQNLQSEILTQEKEKIRLENEISNLNLKFKDEKSNLDEFYKRQIGQLKNAHDDQIEKIEKEFESKLENEKSTSNTEIERLKAEIEREKIATRMKNENISILEESELKISENLKTQKQELATIQNLHETEISQFQSTIENYEQILGQVETKIANMTKQFKFKLAENTKHMQEKIDEKVKTISELEKKLENFGNLNEQKIEIAAKKSAEEQKNKVLRDQIKSLETKIDKITEKERICQVAYAKMETKYGNLEEQIRSSKGENRVLETENLTLKATVNKMQEVMVKTGVFQGNVGDVNEAVSVVEKLFEKENESRNKIESLKQDIGLRLKNNVINL